MIRYKEASFVLEFERPIAFFSFPGQFFRKGIGRKLKEIYCTAKNKDCKSCEHRADCPFGLLYLTQEITTSDGKKITAPPPFIVTPEAVGEGVDSIMMLRVVFVGQQSGDYFRNVYNALGELGKSGISKNNYQFKVLDVFSQDRSLCSMGKLVGEPEFDIWDMNVSYKKIEGSFLVFFSTPYICPNGTRSAMDFNYYEMVEVIEKRATILDQAYGDKSFVVHEVEQTPIQFSDLEIEYYEADTTDEGEFEGGFCGSFRVTGHFSDYEVSLYEFVTIFNIGKRTSEGFGRIYIDLDCDEGVDGGEF
ncbi:MAG: hypothetical protein JXR63_00490 [Spirochaetales bacterium]|nr:hypothetical protein [Spirochaetales bacterium]